MACFTSAVIFLFLAQYISSYEIGIHVAINSPFANPTTAESFARSLINNIVSSGEFGAQGAEDFEDIIESLIQAQSIGKGRHDTNAKAKAMQVALASSIAELVIAESNGSDVQRKTNVISSCLRNALRSTTGGSNEEFIREIQDLIHLLSQEQLNEVDTSGSGQYYKSTSGTCNSNDVNVLMDALLAALHCLDNRGSSSIPASPTAFAMNAYSNSIRRIFQV
nr:flagelliform spidroin 1 [Nephila pilipes]